jgi:hypothetical protein
MDLNGHIKDIDGTPSGIAENPLYVTFSTTVPLSEFHFSGTTRTSSGIKYILEEQTRFRDPRSFLEKVWQKIGILMKWV